MFIDLKHIQHYIMDNFEEIKPDMHEEEVEALWVSEEVRSYLYEAAKWTRFLSIVGFVFAALTLLAAGSAGAVMSAMGPNNPLSQGSPVIFTVVYLVMAGIQFYLSILLRRFSSTMNQAVLYADQESWAKAISILKSFFKFLGFITIGFIALYIIGNIAAAMLLGAK